MCERWGCQNKVITHLHCRQAGVQVRLMSAQVGYDGCSCCMFIPCGLYQVQSMLQGRQLACRRIVLQGGDGICLQQSSCYLCVPDGDVLELAQSSAAAGSLAKRMYACIQRGRQV